MTTGSARPRARRTVAEASVGDELPTLTKQVTVVTNFLFCVSFWAAHSLHYDTAAASDDGFTAPVIPGALMSAYAARVVVEWAGRPDAVRRLYSRNRATAVAGETLTVAGRVTDIERRDKGGLATCELTVTTPSALLMEVTATVELVPAGAA